MRLSLDKRRPLCFVAACAVALAGFATFVPGRLATATDETFFGVNLTVPAPCSVAHCSPWLNGQEQGGGGQMLAAAVGDAPITTTVFTPTPPIAFNIGLGCTAGADAAGVFPQMVLCAGTTITPTPSDLSSTSFLYSLTATSTAAHDNIALTKNWASAPFIAPPLQPWDCTTSPDYPISQTVVDSAPLISDLGYVYVSDKYSMVKYQPNSTDGSGYGNCQWEAQNPDNAALISWNAVNLPAYQNFKGGYYLVGQGHNGPVVLVNKVDATPLVTLPLTPTDQICSPNCQYITHNTISVVSPISSSSVITHGARIYDSTELCPTSQAQGGCPGGGAPQPGRLYAIDILSPSAVTGTPTMKVAWYYDFNGPSGASPMVIPGEDVGQHSPLSDQIYFDGSGLANTQVYTSPTLFGLQDQCQIGTDCGNSPPQVLFTNRFTTIGNPIQDNGWCPDNIPDPKKNTYTGIASAAALENPEKDGSESNHYSVWAHVACSPTLYRFDAQTGALWSGNGASTISITQATGLNGYVAGSTMQTITDTVTGDPVAFMGINKSSSSVAYLTALDLEQQDYRHQLLWKLKAPDDGDPADTPFHGQFPIARTKNGDNVLIAATAGKDNGGVIVGALLH